MNRQTRLVWLGTSVAVAVVWAVGLTLGRPEPRPPASASTSAVEPAEPAGLAEPAEVAEPAQPTQRAPTPTPSAAKTPSATPTVHEHPKSPGQILPHAFASETKDPYWAKDAEAKIRAAFTDAQVPEGSLLSVECRRRVCKAEMWFDSRDHVTFGKAYATLREHFGIDVGFERISSGIRGEPEHLAAYFPRKGYALKDFESPSP